MKKYLLIIVCALFALSLLMCKTPGKTNQKPTTEDSAVLRPPGGYANKDSQRRNLEQARQIMLQLEARPTPCVTVAKPDSVTVTANTATIKWTAYTGINKYYVYQLLVNSGTYFYVGQSSTNSYTASGLVAGSNYKFKVAAVGRGNKTCEMSPEVSMTTSSTQPPNPPPPPPPSGAQANVVFCQFNACTVNDSWWSSSPIVSPGSGLTSDQQLSIFEHMKAIYAPDHPKILFTMDQAVFDAADPNYRVMVVYTTNSSWYGTAGGVAFIGSLNTGHPCWVFTALLNYSTTNVGLADIHEVGHTAGLHHTVTDAGCTLQYGIATLCGDGVWRAPIMGGSYTPYPHVFYRPDRDANIWHLQIPWKQKNDCQPHDEDAIIESHVKQ